METTTDNQISIPNDNQISAPNSDQSPAVAAMAAIKFRVTGDIIAKVCESLPDDQRQAIKWAAGYCRQRNLSCEDFGNLLKQSGNDRPYSGDSVYQALTGRRDAGSLDKFCESVNVLRKRLGETASRGTDLFVETLLTRQVFRTCRLAYERRKLTFVFGPSQIGKTTALAKYAELFNHGETILVRMPTRGALGDFLEELAIRVGIGTQQRHRELRRRIMECFDDRTLLIVDECHQCMSSHYSDRALASLEFCREIYDRRKCGLVLCGTDVFSHGLRNNKVLRQLWLRGYRPLQLPSIPSAENLQDFAKAFKLDAAPDRDRQYEFTDTNPAGERVTTAVKRNPKQIQDDTIRDFGLGRWLSVLEDAADLASDIGARLTWGHVVAAHYNFERIEAL